MENNRKIQIIIPKPGYLNSPVAKASNYITQLDQYLEKHPDCTKVIIYNRVSTRPQGLNLATYKEITTDEMSARNLTIIDYFQEISSGHIINEMGRPIYDERQALVNAIQIAKKRNAIVVAPCTDRLLRHVLYDPKKPGTKPTEYEFEILMAPADGVPLATILHPDMDPSDARGFETRWGQQYKGKYGGRPEKQPAGYKKQIRMEKLPEVLRLSDEGESIADIAKLMGLAWSTVKDWVAKY